MKFVDALAAAVGTRPPVPYTASNASPNLISGYGGARAALINAMGINGTLYATVSRYANATSQVCWNLYRPSRSGLDEDRVQITSHLALDVWKMPNAYEPRQLFIESFQQHMELVGEGWWVIERNMFGWPESMWVVRPDRIAPVPSVERGISGYIYYSPDGQQIPLDAKDVIRLRQPNPADPGPAGRGMGAVQTILSQVEAIALSAQWNRNFFANSAKPGGIIVVPTTLNDASFRRLQLQWGEQHRGVSNAARVGILEGGATWNDGSTHDDMQFVDLQKIGADTIREAFAMPKFLLGLVEDVNRSNAEASDAMFGAWGLVPRLERIKQALNSQFLPLFGAEDLEFDYDTPIPPDANALNKELTTKVNAYVALISAGVDPVDASSTVDLPVMNHIAPVQAPADTGSGAQFAPVEPETADEEDANA